MKTIDFSEKSAIKHIIIMNDSITLYFKGFEELMQVMNMSEEMQQNPHNPLTFVFDHNTEETERSRFHEGINNNYTNEGHYHFEKKDKSNITSFDLLVFVNTLYKYQLLNEKEKNDLLINIFEEDIQQKNKNTLFHKKKRKNYLKPEKKIGKNLKKGKY